MRFITIKTRVTIYFTLMMVLVVALVLVFMLIVGQRVLTNNAEATLLDVVHDNIDDVEYKDGYLDLDELNLYRHNVYILVYDDAQQLIAAPGCATLTATTSSSTARRATSSSTARTTSSTTSTSRIPAATSGCAA